MTTDHRGAGGMEDRGWPTIEAWLRRATNEVVVLPADEAQSLDVLHHLHGSGTTVLETVVRRTGGILVDHGWLRILGSGHELLPRSVSSWNQVDASGQGNRLRGGLLVADDVIGGFFAINGGALPGGRGNISYSAPDSVAWEDTGLGSVGLLQWALSGDLDTFYAGSRWQGWAREVQTVGGGRVLFVYPPLWAQGPSIGERTRRVVPVDEAWRLIASLVMFDCTQFITFDTTGDEASVRQALSDLQELGFQAVAGADIELRKLEYLAEYLSGTTVELFDQDFLGVLQEDWREADEVPARVERFADIVARLARSEAVRNLRVILVGEASMARERIVTRRVGPSGIIGALRVMVVQLSRVWAQILVIEIEDE